MIRDGKPAVTPQTSDALKPVARLQVAKKLTGGAFQTVGTTFAKAIKHCPDCCFAAMDNFTGFVFATSDYNIRDNALAMVAADTYGSRFWYQPVWHSETQPKPWWSCVSWQEGIYDLGTPAGYFQLDALPFDMPAHEWGKTMSASRPAGDVCSLATHINQLAEPANESSNGFLLWFDDDVSLVLPGLLTTQPEFETPLLCAYNVWFVSQWQQNGAGDSAFAQWLVSQYCPEPEPETPVAAVPHLLAVIVNAEYFAQRISPETGDPVFQGWYGDAVDWCRLMSGWAVTWSDRLESGAIPAWIELAMHGDSIAPVPVKLPRDPWRDENGEILTTGSNFSARDVHLEIDNV